jgi:hypothetical protein
MEFNKYYASKNVPLYISESSLAAITRLFRSARRGGSRRRPLGWSAAGRPACTGSASVATDLAARAVTFSLLPTKHRSRPNPL